MSEEVMNDKIKKGKIKGVEAGRVFNTVAALYVV